MLAISKLPESNGIYIHIYVYKVVPHFLNDPHRVLKKENLTLFVRTILGNEILFYLLATQKNSTPSSDVE